MCGHTSTIPQGFPRGTFFTPRFHAHHNSTHPDIREDRRKSCVRAVHLAPSLPSPLVRSQNPCYSPLASHERLSLTRILPLSDLATSDLLHRCTIIRDQLSQAGLFPSLPEQASPPKPPHTTTWRIAITPFPLTKDQLDFFHQLGPQLLSFYRALNRLYTDSVRGLQPVLGRGIPRPRKTGRSADVQPDETVS